MGFLLPHLAGVIVEGVAATAGLLLVTARARAAEALRTLSQHVDDDYISRARLGKARDNMTQTSRS